jgi:hypothetical protein
MRCRSFFCGIASISFTAERLIETLYFSTPFEVFNDVFVREARFVHSIFKCCQVLRIFSKAELYSFIDQVRHRSFGLSSFDPECSM